MALRNRTGRRRAKGQSLPLIGLMIVVLVGMVGLSVDVGNTFNQERQTTSAVNAASLAAMNTVIQRSGQTTNQNVYSSIVKSLNANGVQVAADGVATGSLRRIEAYYMDAQGKPVGPITADGTLVPANVAYVQVQVSGQVDTYFARVVGRNDLPIKASGYAGQCPAGDGIFPLAVEKALLDDTKFLKTPDINPADTMPDDGWRTIMSKAIPELYGMTARHVYIHDGTSQPGSFGFLRWKADTGQTGRSSSSAQELEASLSGTGNLSWGFDEAPAPLVGNNTTVEPAKQPGILNEGDWVYGTPGWQSGGQDPLAQLIANKTKMTLAIYDQAVGQGSGDKDGVRFHVVGFGTFVLLSQGSDKGGKYFDLAYLGSGYKQTTACSTSPVPPNDSDCCELLGSVAVLPQYKIVPQEILPIEWVIVLDQSTSMNSNFAASGSVTAANPSRFDTAKKALTTLINLTNINNSPKRVANTPPDRMAIVGFSTSIVLKTFADGTRFSSNATELINEVNGRTTVASTNGALGLYNASLILQAAPSGINYPTAADKLYTYRKVVVFITDGVSNQFFDMTNSNPPTFGSNITGSIGSSDAGTMKSSPCNSNDNHALNTAWCQLTANTGTRTINSKKYDRPITQAINVSTLYLKGHTPDRYEVFVIALSDASKDPTGLDAGIPSAPEVKHYYPMESYKVYADGTTELDKIMTAINQVVADGACQNGVDPATTSTMLSGQYLPVTLKNGKVLTYPTVGLVTVENASTGYSATEYITADTSGSGKLSYRFAHVPPGVYSLTAQLYYKHASEPDGIGNRAYVLFWDAQTASMLPSLTVELANSASVRAGSLTPSVQRNIDMRLQGYPCANGGL